MASMFEGWDLVFHNQDVMIYTSDNPNSESRYELSRLFSGGRVCETSLGTLRVSVHGHEWWYLARSSPCHILRVPAID